MITVLFGAAHLDNEPTGLRATIVRQ